jgi:ATP synthase mitochondrial F1 complex assembly factor 2
LKKEKVCQTSCRDVAQSITDDSYTITLDSKPLKTRNGTLIIIPPRLSTMAYLIGAEWNIITTGPIRPHSFPLTSLASRALDHFTPGAPVYQRDAVIDQMIRYLNTDSILYFAGGDHFPLKLLQRQTEEWSPVIQWAEKTFGVPILRHTGEHGINRSIRQPEITKQRFREWMERYLLI